jgi:hypothetical protein
MPLRTAEWTEYGVLLPMLTAAETWVTDQQAWVSTIEQLLVNDAARQTLGANARHRANDFTHASTFARWHQLLAQLLDN